MTAGSHISAFSGTPAKKGATLQRPAGQKGRNISVTGEAPCKAMRNNGGAPFIIMQNCLILF